MVSSGHASGSCARADLGGWTAPQPAGPISRMVPSTMMATRSATSRAKAISWVTTIMVVPDAASLRITSRTSPTSSGSSGCWFVKEHDLGIHGQATWQWPPAASARRRAARGRRPPRSPSPTAVSSSVARAVAEARDSLRTVMGPSITFCRAVMCGKEVEMLEDHADLPLLLADLARWKLPQHPVAQLVADDRTIDPDHAVVERLQVVQATQQRALAAARRAQDAQDLAVAAPPGRRP